MNIRFYNARIMVLGEGHQFEVLENSQLWVQGKRIVYIGDGSNIEQVNGGMPIHWDREMDVKGNLIIPGFKNAHTHSAMTFIRSKADDLPLQDWLYQQVFPREGQLTPEDCYYLTALANLEYLTSGITANFDMYFNSYEVAKVASKMGFRTIQVSGANDFGGTVEEMEEKYNAINNIDEFNGYRIGIHAEYTTSMGLMEGTAALAQRLKSPVFLHNSETKSEVEGCIERWGVTPTKLMDKLGMHQYGGGGYHCVWFNDEDIEIYAKNGLYAVTNPGSNTKLASGIAPIKEMLDAGVNIAIGTDGPASNNCLDMFREMFLTTGLAKLRNMDASCVAADEVLYMATVNGARAMGLNDCDQLAVGKYADLVIIDLQQPNMQPINNLVKNIVYSGSKTNVKMTMINGEVKYEDGKFFVDMDPIEIYAKANEIIRRIG